MASIFRDIWSAAFAASLVHQIAAENAKRSVATVIVQAMDALESDATREQRQAAWNALRDEFCPIEDTDSTERFAVEAGATADVAVAAARRELSKRPWWPEQL